MARSRVDQLQALPHAPDYVLEDASPEALLTRLQRTVIFLEKLQDEAVAGFGISFTDFVLLATLRREPPPHALPVSQLAQYVLRPMGSISQAVNRVERLALVTRRAEASDRRKVIVALTPAGLALADESHGAFEGIRKRVFSRLGDDRLADIDASVRALLEALEADHWERLDGLSG